MELRVELENNRAKEHKMNCGMGIQGKKSTKHYLLNMSTQQEKNETLHVEYEYTTRKEQNFACGI